MYKVWKNVPIEERERIAGLPLVYRQNTYQPVYLILKPHDWWGETRSCPLGALNDDSGWHWPPCDDVMLLFKWRGWDEEITLRDIRTFIHAFDGGRIHTPEQLRKALGVAAA